ncbi:MAG: type VI secretion system tip protein VgrG [Desulfobacterales bacterium]|nr:type VI secretion system tip protein VgrG [Desulfobacterales bacterium]
MVRFPKANEPRFLFKVGRTELMVAAFRLEEKISRPFAAELELASEDEIQFDAMVGKVGLLTLESVEGDRHVHGILDRFALSGTNGRFFIYEASLVPQLQLLCLEQDCRIFQNLNVPDIVKQILQDSGITGDRFDFRLQGSYAPRDYCVQYRESDLNFISRLLEEEGIFYYFEHSARNHLLVFGDGTVNYKPISGQAKVIFNAGGALVSEEEAVVALRLTRQIRSGKYTLRDFNFEKPSLDLTSDKSDSENQKREVYDYPGEYAATDEGRRLAQVRLQQAILFKECALGKGVVNRFAPGFTFSLHNHDLDAFNQEYLLTEIVHTGAQPQVLGEKADAAEGTSYENNFTAIPSSVTLRPEVVTPKPVVEGVQTAIVTGPSGEEIYTDKHGRVKVQFHWDRRGAKDEKSSCWVRVSQLWAGAGWGAMFIPRIGQEVIVDFIEGDPDRPIITGRVYHGTNTPPYPLPDDKTKATIMSQTTPNAKTHNELLMQDKSGATYVVLSNAYGHKLTMDEGGQFICLETRDGHKMFFDDKGKNIRAMTTNNHTILISDEQKQITLTSTMGHVLQIDDDKETISAKTAHGNSFLMDDKNTKIEMATEIGGHSMVMNDKTVSIVTGGGHSATLDDGGKGQGIALEDKNGNKMLIDADGDKITIESQGGIDIKTQGDLKIQAANIEMKADQNLELKGGMNLSSEAGMAHKSKGMTLSAEGSTTADFKGGAKATLTGGIVMIN